MGFFSRYKKIFLLLAFLVATLLLFLAIYFMFFRQALLSIPAPGEETETEEAGKLPTAETGGKKNVEEEAAGEILPTEVIASEKADGGLTKTTAISTSPIVGLSLSTDGEGLRYYDNYDGKFYYLNKDGEPELLSDEIFYNVEEISWSPTRNKAILEYPDGSNILYDFETDKQTTLPKHWEDFDFSSDGEKIVAKSIGLDVENRYLIVSNSDGSGARAIEYIGENGNSVYSDWSPNNQIIAMYTQGGDFDREEVYFLGLNEENFKSTTVEGRGFEPLWSPSGSKLLYSIYSTDSDLKPKLWVVDAEGENIGNNRQRINLETWASKCVFADDYTVYCAVPENLEKGSGMFPELAQYVNDNLYKINLKNNQISLIAEPNGSYNMSNLSISADKKILYFSDSNTGILQKINLK